MDEREDDFADDEDDDDFDDDDDDNVTDEGTSKPGKRHTVPLVTLLF